MEMKRKAARGIAVLAVALAAGHLVQSMGHKPALKPAASAGLAKQPTHVETVAAGPAAATVAFTPKATDPMAAAVSPKADVPLKMPAPDVVADVRKVNAVVLAASEPSFQAAACGSSLDLMVEANAMIGVTLLAPCHPHQRVVLHQGGLAVTGKTTATGALFAALPAMETPAMVEVSFADGTRTHAEIAVPDLVTLRRFGLQWQADDTFQIHAFEDGAGYGEPGHVSAANPHAPAPGITAKTGFLSLLGDATTDNPLLAEVYTFPAAPAEKPEVVVEAAVTDKTCARELIAETLTSTGGAVFVTDLTLAMPECAAKGDYLVLKNLVPDLNMASAN